MGKLAQRFFVLIRRNTDHKLLPEFLNNAPLRHLDML